LVSVRIGFDRPTFHGLAFDGQAGIAKGLPAGSANRKQADVAFPNLTLLKMGVVQNGIFDGNTLANRAFCSPRPSVGEGPGERGESAAQSVTRF
jgi:hypothetical protein